MKAKLFLLGLLVSTMTMVGQTSNTTDATTSKRGWNFYVGGSYFGSVVATEFPTVNGNAALSKVYVGGKLVSEESVTGSFGEGFRYGGGAGYRFSDRFGVQMSVNYYTSKSKTMAQTSTDQVFVDSSNKVIYNFKSEGQIRALDLVPAVIFYLGEVKGFESYSKVGLIVPVSGYLEIKTNAVSPTSGAKVYSVDKVNPNPTVGFLAALGTAYKIGGNFSIYGEVEYRNFTVHGKDKETTEFSVNGTDQLATRTVSQTQTNYVDQLTTTSNNALTNPNGIDSSKPTDDLSSYVGISGLGLTFGVKYSL
jgi:hypothetical protein